MDDTQSITAAVNRIAQYLARRDVDELSAAALQKLTGREQADLLILLGNAIPATAVLAARAYGEGLARRVLISGGIGHSTSYLARNMAHPKYKRWSEGIDSRSEAEILAPILRHYGVNDVILETESVHCGDNAQKSLAAVDAAGIEAKTVLLIQDPTMQRRSHASFEKTWESRGTCFVSYAPFIPRTAYRNGGCQLRIPEDMAPAWEWERFLGLILGEISRLRDDSAGYGPRGKGFIVHVDVPDTVIEAAEALIRHFPDMARN